MARPLEFDKDKVLDKALDVFWNKGYEASSLQDLLKAMRISKSSFYQSFSSKEELFKSCLSRYREQVVKDIMKGLSEAPSAYAFLEHLFFDIAEDYRKVADKGCLMINTAGEFAQRHPGIAQLVKDSLSQTQTLFQHAIELAQKQGDISGDKDPQAMAEFLLSNYVGIKTLAKAGVDKLALKAMIDTIFKTLKTP